MNKCKFCNSDTTNRYFCSPACRGKYSSKVDSLPNNMDSTILMIAKINNGLLPNGTLTIIGRKFGVTRERVRQRVKALKIMPVRKAIIKYRELHKNKCVYCHKGFVSKRPEAIYCSDKCRKIFHFYRYNQINVCKYCGLGFLVSKNESSSRKSSQQYCSSKCWGAIAGKRYGAGKGKRIRYPNTKEQLIEIFGESFTINDFQKRYKYNPVYLKRVIKTLIDSGLVEYDLLYTYKIK